MIKTFLDTQ